MALALINQKFIFLSDKNFYQDQNYNKAKNNDLNKNQEGQDFFCREVYVNKNNPWEIKFLFDLDPDIKKNLFSSNNKAKNNACYNKNQNVSGQKINIANINNPNAEQIINKLKNQLDIKNKQLIQKDKQILELTNLLKNKNDEIISLCAIKKKQESNLNLNTKNLNLNPDPSQPNNKFNNKNKNLIAPEKKIFDQDIINKDDQNKKDKKIT